MRSFASLCAAAIYIAAAIIGREASAAPSSPNQEPFGEPGARVQRTAVAPYRFDNTLVRVRFDLVRGVVYGHETVVVRPKHAGLRALPFNSLDIAYQRVLVDGRPAAYSTDRARDLVLVRLPAPAGPSTRLTVDFTYTAHPRAGVFFVRPDSAYPHLTPQIWSQGEPQDNRRWFPTWDEPNEKTPSELVLTVPRGWTAVANGYLRSHVRVGATEIWDWRAPRPKSPYLIAFVAGPLSKHHTTFGRLDVDSFVPPSYAALNATCLGDTNRIVAYFQRVIGARFPWEKYDQIAAERYLFGGMEDTSATILTARALHPAGEDVENSCDVLIAHELAQQWFGDDASWPAFSEVWLGEGFATYFDELWSAERFGRAEFEYARYSAQQAYFAETLAYARPIVDDVYADPIQVFDASSHQRPAQVLHSLRAIVGDERFFAALSAYYRAYRGRYATTHEFFASIGRSLGTDLTWFEDEWFYRTDVPHYLVAQRYDARTATLTLDVAQDNPTHVPFRMPVTIEAYAGGRVIRTTALVDRNDQSVVVAGVPQKPEMVLFDPDATILRRLTFAKPPSELAYQLARARHVGDREWALGELAKLATATGAAHDIARRAVSEAVLGDVFYGVRADAVGVAGTFGDGATVDAALHDTDVRVRIAAAAAAVSPGAVTAAIARDLGAMAADGDAVQAAAALQALGALRAPETYALLVSAVDRRSFDGRVASGALLGLAAYGDARALALLQARTAYGTQESERNAAIRALGQLARQTHSAPTVLPLLSHIATADPLLASRLAAISALGALGDPAALPALKRVAGEDTQIFARLTAEDAIQPLEAAAQRNAGGAAAQ
jgi:aminopeptidase N